MEASAHRASGCVGLSALATTIRTLAGLLVELVEDTDCAATASSPGQWLAMLTPVPQ